MEIEINGSESEVEGYSSKAGREESGAMGGRSAHSPDDQLRVDETSSSQEHLYIGTGRKVYPFQYRFCFHVPSREFSFEIGGKPGDATPDGVSEGTLGRESVKSRTKSTGCTRAEEESRGNGEKIEI